MKIVLRYALPATYFYATRINRWPLVAYNALAEWIPALALAFYFNNFAFNIFGIVILSYSAFICIYEIGYLTNDLFSERFEDDPRGRSQRLNGSRSVVFALVAIRISLFFFISYFLNALTNPLWVTFHLSLAATFGLHNFLTNEFRLPTFFSLSIFRFFGPLILVLNEQTLAVLLPAIFINQSLYRLTVYMGNKNMFIAKERESIKFKLLFYAACVPMSVFLSVFFGSFLPLGACIYFMSVWFLYWGVSKATQRDFSAR